MTDGCPWGDEETVEAPALDFADMEYPPHMTRLLEVAAQPIDWDQVISPAVREKLIHHGHLPG